MRWGAGIASCIGEVIRTGHRYGDIMLPVCLLTPPTTLHGGPFEPFSFKVFYKKTSDIHTTNTDCIVIVCSHRSDLIGCMELSQQIRILTLRSIRRGVAQYDAVPQEDLRNEQEDLTLLSID